MNKTTVTTPDEAITTKIYRAFFELQRHGRKPAAIYLGHYYERELDELTLNRTGSYDTKIKRFADVPVYFIVGDFKHFNVVSEQPYAN